MTWQKKSLLEEDAEPIMPIDVVVEDFFRFLLCLQKEMSAGKICLWSQGSDFDIAILRHICDKYDKEIPVSYRNFRDHRTFFMEGAKLICEKAGTEFDPATAYAMVDDYDGPGMAHDPVYDCKKSIYATWQMMKHLRCFGNNRD